MQFHFGNHVLDVDRRELRRGQFRQNLRRKQPNLRESEPVERLQRGGGQMLQQRNSQRRHRGRAKRRHLGGGHHARLQGAQGRELRDRQLQDHRGSEGRHLRRRERRDLLRRKITNLFGGEFRELSRRQITQLRDGQRCDVVLLQGGDTLGPGDDGPGARLFSLEATKAMDAAQ